MYILSEIYIILKLSIVYEIYVDLINVLHKDIIVRN